MAIRLSDKTSTFLAASLCLLFISGPASAQRDEKVLRDAMVSGIAMGLPGVSVAVGGDEGLVWSGTAGYSDVMRRVPVKADDRFCLGSITKTFVATVVMQLVEEGKLNLEKHATDYLDLEIIRHIPNTGEATLLHLLNHQSGIPTWEFQDNWMRKGRGDQMKLDHVWGKTETLEYCVKELLPATNRPGAKYSYSNTNYTLLGLIIEKVTGNEAAAEIRRRILQPLELRNTFLESFEDVPGGYVHHYHYATPAFQEAAGVHRGFTEIRPFVIETTAANLSPEWTAGGMLSSAPDLLRYARALRDGELLEPATHRAMFTYHPPVGGGSSSHEYMQGISRKKHAYGNYTAVGHSGGTLGFSAQMIWLEETDVIIVMLTNIGGMHSGLSPSPVGLFFDHVLMPAVMKYMNVETSTRPSATRKRQNGRSPAIIP